MQKIETKNIKYTSWIYSVVINLILVIVTGCFLYIFQKSQSADKAFKIHSYLLTVFDENENIADAITAKYTTILQYKNCTGVPLHHNKDVYGFNFSDKSTNSAYHGTLLSQSLLDSKGDCLVHAASFIIGSLVNSNLIAHNGFRYILSERNHFIYTFSHLDAARFNISESRMFNDMHEFVSSVPEYYKRKLTKEIIDKGTVATPIYKDKLTGNNTYSVVSFIYDLNASHRPVAYLLYDHSVEELAQKLSHYTEDMPWLKASIEEKATGEQLCFINCNLYEDGFITDLSESLSNTYRLNIKMYYLKGIISSLTFKIILFMCFVHVFLLQAVIKKTMLRSHEESVVDHLTRLYSRKVLPLIDNKNSRNNYVIMIDCNSFKEINDQYGHNSGDKVLTFISDTIKHHLRKDDIAIRHGGDEFLLILDVSSVKDADEIIRRIARKIASKVFIHDSQKFSVSLSYGIAPLKEDLHSAINEADQQMYIMKNSFYK